MLCRLLLLSTGTFLFQFKHFISSTLSYSPIKNITLWDEGRWSRGSRLCPAVSTSKYETLTSLGVYLYYTDAPFNSSARFMCKLMLLSASKHQTWNHFCSRSRKISFRNTLTFTVMLITKVSALQHNHSALWWVVHHNLSR